MDVVFLLHFLGFHSVYYFAVTLISQIRRWIPLTRIVRLCRFVFPFVLFLLLTVTVLKSINYIATTEIRDQGRHKIIEQFDKEIVSIAEFQTKDNTIPQVNFILKNSRPPTNDEILEAAVKELNMFGNATYHKSMAKLSMILVKHPTKSRSRLYYSVLKTVQALDVKSVNIYFRSLATTSQNDRENITLAFLVCGSRGDQAMQMLKSVVMFSRDANLHLVVVSDKETILKIGKDILSLKLKLNKAGYHLTYELHLEWYPMVAGDPDWRTVKRKCVLQRLFFPSLLKQYDHLIYLDVDVLVLSSLAEMWRIFNTKMNSSTMLGITRNGETAGFYNPKYPVPYYGDHGINTGVMLMNLTQMREFNFEIRAKAMYMAYHEKMLLSDQDIINALFHTFPERVLDINCSYNFYWAHCTGFNCHKNKSSVNRQNICFCREVLDTGVRILHGNSKTFYRDKSGIPFFRDTYEAFEKLDIFTASYDEFFQQLKKSFNNNTGSNCFPLTANLLYYRAEQYLKRLVKVPD